MKKKIFTVLGDAEKTQIVKVKEFALLKDTASEKVTVNFKTVVQLKKSKKTNVLLIMSAEAQEFVLLTLNV